MDKQLDSKTSSIWQNHVTPAGMPEGFSVRTTYPSNPDGVEVMLEQWRAGTSEPPHSHPGDDMTVVIEGKMAVQFYESGPAGLVKVGEPLILNRGDTGYIKANVIHDAKYLEDCKLVFVHDKAFAFNEHKSGV